MNISPTIRQYSSVNGPITASLPRKVKIAHALLGFFRRVAEVSGE